MGTGEGDSTVGTGTVAGEPGIGDAIVVGSSLDGEDTRGSRLINAAIAGTAIAIGLTEVGALAGGAAVLAAIGGTAEEAGKVEGMLGLAGLTGHFGISGVGVLTVGVGGTRGNCGCCGNGARTPAGSGMRTGSTCCTGGRRIDVSLAGSSSGGKSGGRSRSGLSSSGRSRSGSGSPLRTGNGGSGIGRGTGIGNWMRLGPMIAPGLKPRGSKGGPGMRGYLGSRRRRPRIRSFGLYSPGGGGVMSMSLGVPGPR